MPFRFSACDSVGQSTTTQSAIIKMLVVGVFLLSVVVPPIACQSGSTNFLQLFLETADGLSSNNSHTIDRLVGDPCLVDLKLINLAIKDHEMWATKLMDASGRIAASFVWGNNFWLGSKKACARITDPRNVRLSPRYERNTSPNLTSIVAPIPITYRMIYARHSSPLQYDPKIYDKSTLHIGICLPTSCYASDAMRLMKLVLEAPTFAGRDLLGPRVPEVFHSKTLKMREDFFSKPVVISCFVIFGSLLFLTCICTAINVLRKCWSEYQLTKESKKNSRECLDVEKKGEEKKQRKSLWDKFLTCFLVHENARIIFSTYLAPSSLPAIHGVRAISLTWIIIAHLFVYTTSNIGNLAVVLTYAGDWFMQPFNSAAIAVDTFYVLGGLLLSYLHFEQQRKRPRHEGIMTILKTVGNRFFRIAPSYYSVILLAMVVGIFLNDQSQFIMLEDLEENCSKYWWRNLLFINNFYPLSEMCMTWSWYLSVDFQCFTIGTIILVIWTNNKWIAGAIFSIIFLAASFYNGLMGYVLDFQFQLDVEFDTINIMYTALWSRICGYFCGIICGWYLSTYERKLKSSKFTSAVFWILSCFSLLFLVFIRTQDDIPPLASMLYTGLSKIIWAMSVSWVILSVSTSAKGIPKSILESKFLLPFSRLSFSAYLVNPLIIMFLVLCTEIPLLLDFTSLFYISFGIFWIVIYVAILFMMCIENPYTMMVRTFIEGK